MPPRKRGKKPGSKSKKTQRSPKPAVQEAKKKKSTNLTPIAPRRPEQNRASPSSKAITEYVRPIVDDPESIIRKARKFQKAGGIAPTQDQPELRVLSQHASRLAKRIESWLAGGQQCFDYSASYKDSEEASSLLRPGSNPEQIFNLRWGYLPPLNGEALAIIDAIIENPGMAKEYARIGPENLDFDQGLRYRNVLTTESKAPDPFADHVQLLPTKVSVAETADEESSHDQTWNMDQAKCNEGCNEALFQRTLMMSLIMRHRLIYPRNATDPHRLDFSVDEPWTCPPMPTRAYQKGAKFLTQPKPDLAVCFRRESLIPDKVLNEMPLATLQLACYEKGSQTGENRVFHFFAVEAKKAMVSVDDIVAKRQCLNDASQALHNMFEFFRDAGPQHEEVFFAKVRFFSVVVSTDGLIIRIHRATRDTPDGSGQGFIMQDRPDYPLRFEFRELSRISKDNFGRKKVLEIFEKILHGYGAGELYFFLQDALKGLMEKLHNNLEGAKAREKLDFYRYGQMAVEPSSKKQTAAFSQARSVQNSLNMMPPPSRGPSVMNMSVDMPRSDIATSRQNQLPGPLPAWNANGKRRRSLSDNDVPTTHTRKRNQ